MGHDIITFAGRHDVFDDMDLWALRHFFVTEAKTLAHTTQTAEADVAVDFFTGWNWLGPGVYTGIEFDAFASLPGHLATLLRVIESARKRIASFGAVIPLEYLQAQVNTPTAYYTAPQPTERFCGEIDRLITLLKQEPNPPPEPAH